MYRAIVPRASLSFFATRLCCLAPLLIRRGVGHARYTRAIKRCTVCTANSMGVAFHFSSVRRVIRALLLWTMHSTLRGSRSKVRSRSVDEDHFAHAAASGAPPSASRRFSARGSCAALECLRPPVFRVRHCGLTHLTLSLSLLSLSLPPSPISPSPSPSLPVLSRSRSAIACAPEARLPREGATEQRQAMRARRSKGRGRERGARVLHIASS